MINTANIDIDTENKIERDIDGCKVRLFFSLNGNEQIRKQVLDNLVLGFERRMQGLSIVET